MHERGGVSEQGDITRRREVLQRTPDERPIFGELTPLAQEYIRLEYAINQPDLERDEKKILSAQLQRKTQQMFGNNPQADRMRDDITRYGEAVWQELQLKGGA